MKETKKLFFCYSNLSYIILICSLEVNFDEVFWYFQPYSSIKINKLNSNSGF